MPDSTPLPEQGGFNERLSEILDQLHVRGCEITDTETHKACDQFKSKSLTAIRTLVLEEIIGEDIDIPAEMEKVGRDFRQLDAIAKTGGLLNHFKAEQRKKLEDTHGTK